MGLAVAQRLAKFNAKAICIADFNPANFEAVKEQIKATNPSTEVLTTQVDVSSRTSVESWIDEIISKYGALDGAVNCAGVAQKTGARQRPTILEETPEAWERTIGVNLNGIFFSTKAQIAAMVKLQKKPRAIVNISSMASMIHGADAYAYGASKRACASLTTSISGDVAPLGIRLNTVSPSATLTPMLKEFFEGGEHVTAETDLGGWHLIKPEDVAEVVTWLLGDESTNVWGANIPVGAAPP